MTPEASRWRIQVDTGGTFTDCLAVDPGGRVWRAKVLSSGCLRVEALGWEGAERLRIRPPIGLAPGGLPGWTVRWVGETTEVGLASWDGDALTLRGPWPGTSPAGRIAELVCPEEAPVLAARLVTGTPADAALPPLELRLATTLGTNALLERTGARTVLFVTRGFGDLLVIGTQQRPDIFALRIERPEPLAEIVIEVDERLAADGSVVSAMDAESLMPRLRALRDQGMAAAAVALVHSFREPSHERQLTAALRAAGFDDVSASAELASSQGYLARAQTAVVDAYLAPVLGRYLGRIEASTERAPTLVMTSAGGLVRSRSFRPKDGLLSGPAGGVVGATTAGRRSGFERLLTFDMGGTSTDVSRFDRAHAYVFEHRVGDAHLLAPAMAVETVAAGGGSICSFRQGRLQVGPESGGATPGPASYGAGGPLCVTDVNLLLGRLVPSRFHIPIDPTAAERAVHGLEATIALEAEVPPRETLLGGLLRIADETMADAIRRISVRRGYDPTEFTLLAFGGAGPQHACAVAELLGMRSIVVPLDAGLLSAVGLGAAVIERFAQREVLRPLEEVGHEVEGWWESLAEQAREAVVSEGVPIDEVEVRRRIVEVRLVGQESALQIEPGADRSLRSLFRRRYRELYGYDPDERPLELVSLRVVAGSRSALLAELAPAAAAAVAAPTELRPAWFEGAWLETSVYDRGRLSPGRWFVGPALVVESHSTTVVTPGWTGRVDGASALILSREA